MAKRMNSIEAFIGGVVETPEIGYGHTDPVLKGYTVALSCLMKELWILGMTNEEQITKVELTDKW